MFELRVKFEDADFMDTDVADLGEWRAAIMDELGIGCSQPQLDAWVKDIS